MLEPYSDHIARSERNLVITITSGMGSLADNTSGGSIAYRSSKAAVNMVMRSAAIDLALARALSLMIACYLDESLAKRWIAGKQIGNAEVRRVLGKHPLGEPQEQTQELYNFFSKTTHPNRDQIAQRFLGEGNEFVALRGWFSQSRQARIMGSSY